MADNLKTLTTDIIANHIGHNKVSAGDLPTLITTVYQALSIAAAPPAPATPAQQPAVPIRSSVKPDYILSLESGRKLKTLKRYLMNRYGMSPSDYRQKWGLPADYPMTAANYSKQGRAAALKIGLGQTRRKIAKSKPPVSTAGKRRK